jgi:membrane protein
VSRVIGYSRIYGALGILPVLLVGLYFSWIIVLLGAQVSYAAQNVRSYLQQRAGERIDQRGRELLACRAVYVACEHFAKGLKPPGVDELADRIGAPPQWLNQLLHRLKEHGLLARVSEGEPGIVPARPLERITIADVLHAVRNSPESIDNSRRNAEGAIVEKLLAEFQTAERACSANVAFSELVNRV